MATIVLAHDAFCAGWAKTAEAILRYGDDPVVAIVDRAGAGRSSAEIVPDAPKEAPVVATMEEALAFGPDRLVIGVAPVGGRLPPSWRDEVAYALSKGVDVVSGLHTYLNEDTFFAKKAEQGGATMTDLRRPPREKPIWSGAVLDLPCRIVLTVGTDCSVGKMTTTVELARELAARGRRVAWVATGQSGLLCGPASGVVIDAIGADFLAGWSERIVLEAYERTQADIVLVEGQGALTHPAYAPVSLGLLHGSAPHAVVLCHDAARTHKSADFHKGRTFPVLDPAEEWALVQAMAGAVRAPTLAGLALMNAPEDDAPLAGPEDVPVGNVLQPEGRARLADALEALG